MPRSVKKSRRARVEHTRVATTTSVSLVSMPDLPLPPLACSRYASSMVRLT